VKLLAFPDSHLLLEYFNRLGREVGEEDGDGGGLGGEGDGGEGHVSDRFGLERVLALLNPENNDAIIWIALQQEVAVVAGEWNSVYDVRDWNYSSIYVEYSHRLFDSWI
jgi:hypothetical protein